MENVDPQPMDLVEPTKPPAPPAAQPETAVAPESAKAPEHAKAEEPAKVENVEINYTAKEKRMSMTRRRIAVR